MPAETAPAAYAAIAPTDLRPHLLAALRSGGLAETADHWTCRACGAATPFVVVVPYDGAWRHAVEPLCELHYPTDLPMLWTTGWPGPATTPKYARDARRAGDLAAALANVEKAARELDALFDGNPHRWTLDGRKVTDDASAALLSLHDYLNDVDVTREARDGR